jgi:cobalt-zinc-cadmium efflux system membrane fusion protein
MRRWILLAILWMPGCEVEEMRDDWCVEHEVAESRCPFCNPSLVETMGFCEGHGVPEALCTRCDPDVIPAFQAVGDWCAGHEIPESQCEICSPPAMKEEAVDIERVPDDEIPRSARAPSVLCETEKLRIRLRSPEVARNAGLGVAVVEERSIRRVIDAHVEIAHDENRLARVGARVPGIIREVGRDLGESVEAGQTIAVIDSAELGTTKADHLQAIALQALWKRNRDRERALLEKGIATEQDAHEAETRYEEHRIAVERTAQGLRHLGLDDEEIREVARSGNTSSLLPLHAPRSGVVLERSAVIGQVVDPTDTLFVLADPAHMWAMLDIYETDLGRVAVGQDVVIRIDGLDGETYPGRITWVGTSVDPRTRTIPARAEMENPDGLLRANMFGEGEIQVGAGDVVAVPREAVQWEGCCNVVFLRRSETLYEPRKVRLGYSTRTVYEVLDGLVPGDRVVTDGAFLLKTEILKESIGAGCCGDPATN